MSTDAPTDSSVTHGADGRDSTTAVQYDSYEILPLVPRVAIVKVTTTPTGFFGHAIHSMVEKSCGHFASVSCLPEHEPRVGEVIPCHVCYTVQRDHATENGLTLVRLPNGEHAWLRPEPALKSAS